MTAGTQMQARQTSAGVPLSGKMSRSDAVRQGLRYYFTGTPCKHGHIAPRHTRNSVCAQCLKTHKKEWYGRNWNKVQKQSHKYYLNNKESHNQNSARNHKRRKQTLRGKLAVKLGRVKARCLYSGLVFNLTPDYLVELWQNQKGRCALSGERMALSGTVLAVSCSLDRIDPYKGYVAGNVRLLCNWVNVARGTMTDRQFIHRVRRFSYFVDKLFKEKSQ